jgi:hypothetical protein
VNQYYILNGQTPIPCIDVSTFSRWFENADRQVCVDIIDGVRVSTVFLGLDHRWSEGPPLLFETMIFGGEHDQYQNRYSTWAEAVEGHAKALALVKGSK